MEIPQGTIISYATQAGRTAEDGAGHNSPYTTAFLKHIEEQDEIGTIFRRISADVYETTKHIQLPELSLSLVGEFYLRGTPSSAAASPSPLPVPQDRGKTLDDEASYAWEQIKNSESKELLEKFISRYANTFYADVARARLKELSAKLANAPPSPAPSEDVSQPNTRHNHPEQTRRQTRRQVASGPHWHPHTIGTRCSGQLKIVGPVGHGVWMCRD